VSLLVKCVFEGLNNIVVTPRVIGYRRHTHLRSFMVWI